VFLKLCTSLLQSAILPIVLKKKKKKKEKGEGGKKRKKGKRFRRWQELARDPENSGRMLGTFTKFRAKEGKKRGEKEDMRERFRRNNGDPRCLID